MMLLQLLVSSGNKNQLTVNMTKARVNLLRAEMSSRLEVQPRTCFDKRAKSTCIEEKEDI